MRNFRDNSFPSMMIIAGCLTATILVLAVLVAATNALRVEARDRYFEQYNRQQLLLAQEAADKIKEQFDSIYIGLNLAGQLIKDDKLALSSSKAISQKLHLVLNAMSGSPLLEYAVFDAEGTIVGMEPFDAYTLGRNYSWRDYYKWARDEGVRGARYLSPFMEMAGGLLRGDKALIAATGFYDDDGEFEGMIIGLISFDELARRHVLPVKVGEDGYAWLVDSKNSSILVDPQGRVSGKSFDEAFGDRWPKLHSLLMNTKNGEAGTGWYEYEDPSDPLKTVRKLVGYAPIQIGNRLWTLGVCTPEREVEQYMSSVLDRQNVLSGLSIGVTLTGALALAVLLLTWNRSLSRLVSIRTLELTRARSELEKTFEELLLSKKFAALGRLSTGIVHEIRNPLSAVSMNMQIIRMNIRNKSELEENFGIVEDEIERLNAMLNDVMEFARPAPLRLTDVDAVELARKVILLMENKLEEEGIRLSIRWELSPTTLRCDEGKIRQVILNLVLNAADALREVAEDKLVVVSVSQRDDSVFYTVEDNGVGVPEEEREKIFDPFYTTKAQGGGLGLSIAQNVVMRHGGNIEISDTPYGGCCFTVQLPGDGPTTMEAVTR